MPINSKEYHSPCGSIHMYNSDYKKLHDLGMHWDIAFPDPPYGLNAPKMQMGSHPNRKENGQYPGRSTTAKLKSRLNSGGGTDQDRKLNKSAFAWDNKPPSRAYFKMLKQISTDQIIWGGNYFDLPKTRCWVVWDKLQPWENFSQFEMCWTSFDKPAVMIKVSNTGGANSEPKIHPTQKPVKLYDECIRRLIAPGSSIIDTHGGSLSLALAVWNANTYDSMGLTLHIFEKDPFYFDAGVSWFKSHIETPSLFPIGTNAEQTKIIL